MMGLEVLVGVVVYVTMVILLRAKIVGQAKELIENKLH